MVMRINIYTAFNGVGLQKDYNILKSIFEAAGHEVDYSDWKNIRSHAPRKADIALHLEIARPELMRLADRNILMPNPEWFDTRWKTAIRRFDAVWCKTQDCLRIFSALHSNCVFTGFTSLDFHLPEIKKAAQMLHVQGKSDFKGTHEIMQAYSTADLPKLYLLSGKVQTAPDNIVCGGFLSDEDFRKLINLCAIHLCPSYYEGFGHYIWEAMSCGCVVLTTDAAPMNEFVTDPRFLVKIQPGYPHHLGTLHRPDVGDLTAKIKSVSEMPIAELIKVGSDNRERYLTNHYRFVNRIRELL